MDDDCIVTAFVIIDKTRAALGHWDDVRAPASDAEVLTVAVAATYFQRHQARALQVMYLGGCLSGALSVSRVSRRVRLRARTGHGLELKLHAALLAATITNAD